jgi:hypothetical protein
VEAVAGCWSSKDLEDQWSTLTEDSAPRAIELLWLGQLMGCDAFVADHLKIAKRRWRWPERPAIAIYALALKSATCGSILDRLVLTPFLNLLGCLQGVEAACGVDNLDSVSPLERKMWLL